MHTENLRNWQHSHIFGQDRRRPGEVRTLVVIGITAAMTAVEVAAGVLFGSMALLADGLHMASHAAALSINAFAYAHARRHARDPRYSFGTGKVNALGGFSGALLLALFSLSMAWESLVRFAHPVEIVFNQAILVAVLGLLVNGACVFILGVEEQDRGTAEPQADRAHQGDHNLKAAYLHVMADALTSVLAVFALLAAKYAGFVWMDPAMGIVGAILVARWSMGLLRATSGVLLDRQGPARIRERIRESIERDGDSRVSDLHLWAVGPDVYAAIVVVVAHAAATPEEYKARIPADLGLAHVTIEVHESPRAGSERTCSRTAPGM
jgi:cation diffusion facilitator family transporter